MAEFCEVMRLAKVICDMYDNESDTWSCGECPLYSSTSGCIMYDACNMSPEEVYKSEKIIFDWHKTHIFTYPTWFEVIEKMDPNKSVMNALNTPIPEKVAKALDMKLTAKIINASKN